VSWPGPREPRGASRTLLALSLLAAACSRARTESPPVASAVPAMSAEPPSAGPASSADVPGVAAPAPEDPRPTALKRLVPIDDPDAGNAAPTGLVPDCEQQLARAGVTFRSAQLPVHTSPGSKATCGAPQVVTYVRGPGKIAYEPTPLLTCAMALALASFERIVQEEADRQFQSPVVRVQQIGTYSCREIAAVRGLPSEHSYANAIDLTRFTLANGKAITVLDDFDMGDGPPARPAGAFLRAVSERAHYENVFSNVLTAFWDPAHKSHFHLDLARYRVNGVKPLRP
jgi:hypothetical protein